MFRAAIPLISTAMEAILQFRSLYLNPRRLKMQAIIRLCPPIWIPSPSPSYFFFPSDYLPCFTITVLSSPIPFLSPVTLLLPHFLGTESQAVGRTELFLGHLFSSPRHKRLHKPRHLCACSPWGWGDVWAIQDEGHVLYYKELRSQTSLYCATLYRYFKSISSPNLAI